MIVKPSSAKLDERSEKKKLLKDTSNICLLFLNKYIGNFTPSSKKLDKTLLKRQNSSTSTPTKVRVALKGGPIFACCAGTNKRAAKWKRSSAISTNNLRRIKKKESWRRNRTDIFRFANKYIAFMLPSNY